MSVAVQPLIHLDRLGMKHNPFPVAPDASNYFISGSMQKHLVEIIHCIDARMGFVLIIGDVGIGKSTLSRYLLKQLDVREVSTAIVLNTFLQGESLIGAINRDYGIDDVGGMEQRIAALNAFLLDHFRQGKNCVIMIDDAQNLSLESLELVRQISNLETEQEKLVQIILIAQPEILDTLGRRDIRQLKSRIALTVRMPNLSRHDLMRYVRFRLDHAGNTMDIHLSALALMILHWETSGFPRRVNLMMDRCLYVAAAYGKSRINALLVRKAAKELNVVQTSGRLAWHYGMMMTVIAMVSMMAWNSAIAWPDQSQWHDFQRHALMALHLAPYQESHSVQKNTMTLTADNDHGRQGKAIAPLPALDKKQRDMNAQHFLAFYGLEGRLDQFLQARDSRILDGMVFEPGGWQALVKNYSIPSDKDHKVLTYTEIDGLQRWLTLWKPVMRFEHFHYFLQSPDVVILQRMLASLGFYPFPVDNMVGNHTLEGIISFQSRAGLSPTGYPDVYTLYVMQRQFNARKARGLFHVHHDGDRAQPSLIANLSVAGTIINTVSTHHVGETNQ